MPPEKPPSPHLSRDLPVGFSSSTSVTTPFSRPLKSPKGLSLSGRRVNCRLDLRNPVRREFTLLRVFSHQLRVGCYIDTVDLVIRDIAVHPVDLGTKIPLGHRMTFVRWPSDPEHLACLHQEYLAQSHTWASLSSLSWLDGCQPYCVSAI